MSEQEKDRYAKYFYKDKKRLNYLRYYDSFDDALDALQRASADSPYEWSMWKTLNGKFTIVRDRDRQAAANFGYGEVVYGEHGEYLGISETCDGSKTYVYQKYREFDLL